jgi:predicted esterase
MKLIAIFCCTVSLPALAATITLPAWRCDGSALRVSGFEDNEAAIVNPSNGSGGAPNDAVYTITGPAGTATYAVYPSLLYDPTIPAPLVLALHGTVPDGLSAAQNITLNWAFAARPAGAIVIAPVGSAFSVSGGSGFTWSLVNNDRIKLDAVIADVKQRYNIDQNRIYGWGFSAGAHVLHKWALENNNFVVAYTAHAGALNATSSGGLPALSQTKLPVLIYHSPDDSTVPYSQAQLDRQRFLNAGWTDGSNFALTDYPGGHFYGERDMETAWNFVCRFARAP